MNEVLIYSCFILFGTFISAVSQVMLKKAADKKYENKLKEYLNPWVIGAYAIFVAATFLTIIAYKVVPLSLGPVLEATGYIYVTIFGHKFFGEKVNSRKVIALFLIIVGIAVYSVLG